jgi:hypothetical protein
MGLAHLRHRLSADTGFFKAQSSVTITCHEPILVQVADLAPTWCQSGTTIMKNLRHRAGSARRPTRAVDS